MSLPRVEIVALDKTFFTSDEQGTCIEIENNLNTMDKIYHSGYNIGDILTLVFGLLYDVKLSRFAVVINNGEFTLNFQNADSLDHFYNYYWLQQN